MVAEAHGPPGVVRIALTSFRWPLEPARVEGRDELTLARALFATPYRVDARTGALRAGLCDHSLAVAWRRWSFRCRQAQAIAAALRRVRWIAAAARRIDARGDRLRVELRFPWRRFRYALTIPAAAPGGVAGPFRLVRGSAKEVVAERPGLRLIFRRLDPRAAERRYRAGRIDEAPVPLGSLGLHRDDGALHVEHLLAVDLIRFGRVGGQEMRQVYWRTAGRADYADVIGEGTFTPAFGLLPGHVEPVGADEFRRARARVRSLPAARVPISGPPGLVYPVQTLVAHWRDLGLGPEVARNRRDARFERLAAPYPRAEALLAALLLPQPPSPARRLLVRALGASHPRPLLVRTDELLRRDAKVVPIAWGADARLVSPRLTGWREDALGAVDYTTVKARARSRSR